MAIHHLTQGRARPRVVAVIGLALMAAACGSSRHSTTTSAAALPRALVREARPIGRGPAFHPAVRGQPIGPCRQRLGPRTAAHVELFAANRVVLIAAGIGARAPTRRVDGRIVSARCFGALVTRDPTGIVLVRTGAHLTVGELMRSWGQRLSRGRLLTFHGAVSAYVDGRRWTATPADRIPLTSHAEIVLEVGPHVPPHHSFTFPPGL